MWGRSYLSGVQWVMADQLPPEVKALVLSVNGTERYRHMQRPPESLESRNVLVLE
jgi:predicted acyl esterase